MFVFGFNVDSAKVFAALAIATFCFVPVRDTCFAPWTRLTFRVRVVLFVLVFAVWTGITSVLASIKVLAWATSAAPAR